jgi:hypothetical protein
MRSHILLRTKWVFSVWLTTQASRQHALPAAVNGVRLTKSKQFSTTFRWPVISNCFSNIRGKWRPTLRVDIFDRYREMLQGVDGIKIGEVLTDGNHGQVEIIADNFREDLTELFSKPLFIFCGGGQESNGNRIDAGTTLPPWRKDTLEYVVTYELSMRNLRGVIVPLTYDTPSKV